MQNFIEKHKKLQQQSKELTAKIYDALYSGDDALMDEAIEAIKYVVSLREDKNKQLNQLKGINAALQDKTAITESIDSVLGHYKNEGS